MVFWSALKKSLLFFFCFSDSCLVIEMGKWNDFLLSGLASLRDSGNYCDTEISTNDNGQLTAHSCLLVAASPVLRSLFNDVVSTKIIKLPYSKEIVKLALDFIYQGTMTIPVDTHKLDQLLSFAERFRLDHLVEICRKVKLMLARHSNNSNIKNVIVNGEDIQLMITAVAGINVQILEENDSNTVINFVDEVDYDVDSPSVELLQHDLHANIDTDSQCQVETFMETKGQSDDPTSIRSMDHGSASITDVPPLTTDWKHRPDDPEEFPEHLKAFAVKPGEEPIIGVDDTECTFCKQKFQSRTKYFSHVRNVHPVPGLIRCRICLQDFSSPTILKAHKVKEHYKTRTYECEICGVVKQMKSHMKYHMTSHTGEKPYACNYCDRTFRSQSAKCSHERVHTGEKPFVCSICGRGFINSSNCNSHKKHVHKVHK